MEVGLLVFGVLVGIGISAYLLERYRKDEVQALEAGFAARLKQLQDELRQADAAHAETKERLIALQMEHKALQDAGRPREAELIEARRAAEQAKEQEAQHRQRAAALEGEIDRLQRELAELRTKPATPGEPTPARRRAGRGASRRQNPDR
jgi:chromosome segregation ATPase